MQNTFQLVPYTDKYYDFVYETKKNAYIIRIGNKDVGFYNDEELEDGSYEIGNICIEPKFQGKGLGTMLLKEKLEEHKEQDVKIQFFKQNPVGKLYERLGFISNGETEFHYQMIKPKELKKVK